MIASDFRVLTEKGLLQWEMHLRLRSPVIDQMAL
jgi:hypothetical protein